MILFRLRGVILENKSKFWDHDIEEKIQVKKVYYLESKNIQKALAKAKKIFNHVHSVEQVNGEMYKEEGSK